MGGWVTAYGLVWGREGLEDQIALGTPAVLPSVPEPSSPFKLIQKQVVATTAELSSLD